MYFASTNQEEWGIMPLVEQSGNRMAHILEDLSRNGQSECPSTYHVVHPYHGQGITMHSRSTLENFGNINEPSLSSVSYTFTFT